MKTSRLLAGALLAAILLAPSFASAGVASTAAEGVGTAVFGKFGKGLAGSTADEIALATEKIVTRHGTDALPLLKNAGHDGFRALNDAGENAPKIVRLYTKQGDEALWVILDPRRQAIFLKHGDSAAVALSKHPGIADGLIERFGDDGVAILQTSSRQSAQRFAMLADEGVLSATGRSAELLPVLRRYGDPAMDFVWQNKGALAVTSVLATFLLDPQAYISGAKDLLVPVIESVNWTLIAIVLLAIGFLPKTLRAMFRTKTNRAKKEKNVSAI